MYLLKYLIIIMSISSCLTLKSKLKQEQSIFVTFLGINLFTYILGIFNLLKYSVIIIYIISIISVILLIFLLIKDKSRIKELLTFPVFFYIILLVLVYVFTKKISFSEYDEYMFWGTNLKAMVYKNVLWAHKIFDGIHLTYPPLSAINEYLFCKLNGFYSENSAYFGMATFLITLVLPVLKNKKNTFKNICETILIYLSLYISIIHLQFKLSNLMVDLLLGVNFAIAFYLVYSKENKISYILIVMSLISLTLIKTNGILLSLIILMYMFIVNVLLPENKNIKNLLPLFLVLISIMFAFMSWEFYCFINGTVIDERHDKHNIEDFDTTEFLNALMLQEDKCSERNYKLVKDFYEKMRLEPTSDMIKISPLCLAIIFNVIGIMISIKRKNRKIALVFAVLDIGFIICLLSVIFIYMFIFVEFQGNVLMDMYRYINMYLVSYAFLTFFITNEKKEYYIYICEILLLIILININFSNIIDYHTDIFTPQLISKMEILESIYIKSNVKNSEKVFFIDQRKEGGCTFVQMRYLLSPIKTNLLYEWYITIGIPDIYYQTTISENELKNILMEEYDYIYFFTIDKSFVKEYANLFKDVNIQDKCLYKIDKIDSEIFFSVVSRQK